MLAVVSAGAQPRGPADLISGAKKARDEKELADSVERAEPAAEQTPDGEATKAQAEPETPAAPQAERAGQAPGPSTAADAQSEAQAQSAAQDLVTPQLSQTVPKRDIAAGVIVVRIVDADSNPVADASVRVGILKADGSRDSIDSKSDDKGVATFSGLPVGDQQAYRVSVSGDGATIGANPFRLPHDRGYEVSLRRLSTTTDATKVVLYVGAASVELNDERLKVAEQLRLINIDRAAYVFPEEGLLIKLPEGFTAFQTQETMGDQKVTSDEEGVRIKGSLPPGQTTLLWGFDLPITGTEMTITLDNPFNTYGFRVLVDAAKGLEVKVDEMPVPETHESQGARFWITEVTRKAEQGPFKAIRIHLSGIPGPGPSRWVAAGLALLVLLGGVFLATRREQGPADPAAAVAERKRQLLQQLAELSAEHERGEVGPEFFSEEKGRLTDAIAVLLWEEQQLKQSRAAA